MLSLELEHHLNFFRFKIMKLRAENIVKKIQEKTVFLKSLEVSQGEIVGLRTNGAGKTTSVLYDSWFSDPK